MKISDVTTSKAASSLRKRRDVSGSGGFENYLSEPANVDTASQTTPVENVDALLSVQEVGDALSAPNKEGMRVGFDTLETLDELRLALLQGALPQPTLVNIRAQIERQKANISDPRLRAILQEIELRAEVELAKLEMAALKTA